MLGKKYSKKQYVCLVSLLLLLAASLTLLIGPKDSSRSVKLTAHVTTTISTTSSSSTTTTVFVPSTTIKVAQASRGNRLPRYSGPITDETFYRLALCESGARPDAVSRNGRYFGAFQFMLSTWRSVGGPGNPIDHPYETQLHYAKILQARSGWGQWPVCSRRLGLR